MIEELAPWGIIIAMAVVLAFCMPFFVFKIRNQVVSINEKLARVIVLLEAQAPETGNDRNLGPQIEIDEKGRKIKTCPECAKPNHPKDTKCIHCGYGFLVFEV